MSRLDELPADQKAVLQLLLKQGKTYEELAALLRLDATAVRERALDALDALGPDAPEGLTSAEQDDIADYLLGQQSASERAQTRERLQASAPGRAWARVVAGQLRDGGFAAEGLPEIPADHVELDEAFEARDARAAAGERQQRSSKLGGLLVILGTAIALVLLVVVLLNGGDDKKSSSDAKAASTATTATTSTNAQAGILAQINMTGTDRDKDALGAAFLTQPGDGQTRPGVQVIGDKLTKSNRYAVWLYTSQSQAKFLGFARYVSANRILGVLPTLPAGYDQFKEIVVTKEPVNKPTAPGPIYLRGPLSS